MPQKKQYVRPEVKRWGTITDLTRAGLFEAIFGGGSSKGGGGSPSSPTGGTDGKIGSIIP